MLKRNDEKSAEYYVPTPTTSTPTEDLSIENNDQKVLLSIIF